jgi:hypothetical protein
MRTSSLACLVALAASLALAPAGRAQQPPPATMKIEKVKLGFRSGAAEDAGATYKPGLWVPVHITLVAAPDGPIALPVGLDNFVEGEVRIETADSDGIPNIYPEPFRVRRKERIHLTAYAKLAATNPELKVFIRPGPEGSRGRDVPFPGAPEGREGREINDSLYLTLGARLPDLQKALPGLVQNRQDPTETRPRYTAHETEVHRLPTRWFGYDAIDLVILTTDNDAFLKEWLKTENKPRVEALAEWVRRGGRLVVSVSWRNQELVHRLLTDRNAWQPALPDVLNPAPAKQPFVSTMFGLPGWAGVPGNALSKKDDKGLYLPELKASPGVEILAKEGDFPLMLRTPYGRGNITLLAFNVDKDPFTSWQGAQKFWQAAVTRWAPPVLLQGDDQRGVPRNQRQGGDLTTRLQVELDKFDTPPISFGWVALFILLYILVVGPLDYLLLKKVFKRLELTWITFPAVVLAISLIAYFTAYAIKGKDLKVNKIDLVDIDLRSDLGEDLRPRGALAYGRSWFTILSPRIQNYTIGVEPVLPRLLGGGKDVPPAMVTWLGRPETGGMGASGRRQSQGLFTRTYQYEPGGLGLKDVAIPVWTTKSFTAYWKASLKKMPFEVRLEYEKEGGNVTGTIKSNLPADLQDVTLIYGDKWYRLPNCQASGLPLKIDLSREAGREIRSWAQPVGNPQPVAFDPEDMLPGGPYDPGPVLKDLLFHQEGGPFSQYSNHVERRLDASWRVRRSWPEDLVVREAILVGRLARARGSAETLTAENDPRLPTHLWLGALPGGEQARPTLSGTMVQDTYVRVIVPVSPKKQ